MRLNWAPCLPYNHKTTSFKKYRNLENNGILQNCDCPTLLLESLFTNPLQKIGYLLAIITDVEGKRLEPHLVPLSILVKRFRKGTR